MKKIKTLVLLSLIVVLFSCSGNINEKSSDSLNQDSINKKNSALHLHGEWISKDYLDDLEKTKSPFESRGSYGEMISISFDSTNLLSNEARLNGCNAHEGGYGFFLKYNSATKEFESKDSSYDNVIIKVVDATTINLKNLTKGTDTYFIYSKNGLTQTINKILFAGYITEVRPDTGTYPPIPVFFYEDGRCNKFLETYKQYHIQSL